MTPCPTCRAPAAPDAAFCGACGGKLGGKPTDPMIGRTIADGRYTVLRRLGEGGMGTVYEVEQVSLRRRAALKVLKPELFDTPGVLRRFQSEAELAARLSHPNTVTLYDFGTMEDGGRFMTMELVTGRTLRAELDRGALPLARAIHIVRQVASSLADAHAAGIVHRDLKPDNVMLSERAGVADFVRVLDFGIAKLRDERAGGITAMPQTQAGSLVGTPQYMSPEQITGGAVDARTDVYALGGLLYQLVTGRLPFTGTTLPAILAQHLQEIPPTPSRVRPDLNLPPAFDALVLACLEKDPNRRPPSMTDVLARLNALESAITTNAFTAPTPAVTPPPTRAQPTPRRGLPVPVRVVFGAAGIAAMIMGGLQLRSALKPSSTSSPDAVLASAPPSAPDAAPPPRPDDDRPLGWPAPDDTVHSVPAPAPPPAPAPKPTAHPPWRRRGNTFTTPHDVRVTLPFSNPQVQIQDAFFVAVDRDASAIVSCAVTVAPLGATAAAMAPTIFAALATQLGGTVGPIDSQPLANRRMPHATITAATGTFHAYTDVIGPELVMFAIGGPESPAMQRLGARFVTSGVRYPTP